MRISFRNGFFGGAMVAFVAGLYLTWLWQSTRQVQLHTRHLISQIENRDWPAVRSVIAADYRDDWEDDRERLIERMRDVLRYTRNLQINALDPQVQINGRIGSWSAKIKLNGDSGEAMTLINDRVNSLSEAFKLEWRRESAKPWDWKLTRATNKELRIAREEY